MNNSYSVRSRHYNLRPRKDRSTNKSSNAFELSLQNVNEGLKIFGHAGESSVAMELKHLHSQKVIEPNHHHELTDNEHVDSLRYPMIPQR